MLKFLKKAILINSAVILAIAVGLTFVFITPLGRPALKTILLVPEVVPNFPIHPLQWVTREPIIEEMEISSGPEKIKTYIYRPNDSKRHPTVILVITGVLPISEIIVRQAQGFARIGFVVVVPDIPGLTDVKKTNIRPKQISSLVEIFRAVSTKEFVNPKKIGFMGICVGGSLSLVAAEDSLISSQVKYVIAISAYFDTFTTYEQIYLKTIKENGKIYNWTPQPDTILATDRLLISTLPNEEEREIFEEFIIKGKNKTIQNQLSSDAEKIYNFINNSNLERFFQLWDELPEETKKVLAEVSPKSKINDLKAHVFILNDNKDDYVSHTEGQALAKSLPSSQRDYIGLDLLEHSQLVRKLPRLKTLTEIVRVSFFVSKILAQIS